MNIFIVRFCKFHVTEIRKINEWIDIFPEEDFCLMKGAVRILVACVVWHPVHRQCSIYSNIRQVKTRKNLLLYASFDVSWNQRVSCNSTHLFRDVSNYNVSFQNMWHLLPNQHPRWHSLGFTHWHLLAGCIAVVVQNTLGFVFERYHVFIKFYRVELKRCGFKFSPE